MEHQKQEAHAPSDEGREPADERIEDLEPTEDETAHVKGGSVTIAHEGMEPR